MMAGEMADLSAFEIGLVEALRDDWVDRPGLSAEQRTALEALPAAELATALLDHAADDHFWGALDMLRSDATDWLLSAHRLGPEQV